MINFDEIINRNTPEDLKHAKIEGIDDLIPMWVADMDFRAPDEVVEALVLPAGIREDTAGTWIPRLS